MAKNKKSCGSWNWCGLVTILVGLYFLAVDLGYLNELINWWTIIFLIMGLCCLTRSGCSMCKA